MSEYVMKINENPTVKLDGFNVLCDDMLIQREKIVRCRDCMYYERHAYSHFTCELLTFPVGKGGFCAWGERREEGKQNESF